MSGDQLVRCDAAATLEQEKRPRLGFAGLGWIGRSRLDSLVTKEIAEVAALCDPRHDALSAAAATAPRAVRAESFEEMLECDLDGVVIATPSALHARQVTQALERGLAVFCQKPLARTAAETEAILQVARDADCLLHVDLSYRFINGVLEARNLVQDGALGTIFFVDLNFHNAYGPDKAWFRDYELSGGGCVIDLATHLIDLAGWILNDRQFRNLRSTLWHDGQLVSPDHRTVEDAAIAEWNTPGDAQVRLACSWNLHAGQHAVIGADFYGTHGAISMRNCHGSFYDFAVTQNQGTQRHLLATHSSDWGGQALAHWTQRLLQQNRFDEEATHLRDVARLIDGVYGR